MSADLTRLETLKEMLKNATKFSEPLNYFFDHFGENADFMAMGETARDEFLESVIGQVGRQLFGSQVSVAGLRLIRLPEHGFTHGGFLLNGRIGTIFYFDDILFGLMSVAVSVTPSGTRIMRFQGRAVPGTWNRSAN